MSVSKMGKQCVEGEGLLRSRPGEDLQASDLLKKFSQAKPTREKQDGESEKLSQALISGKSAWRVDSF